MYERRAEQQHHLYDPAYLLIVSVLSAPAILQYITKCIRCAATSPSTKRGDRQHWKTHVPVDPGPVKFPSMGVQPTDCIMGHWKIITFRSVGTQSHIQTYIKMRYKRHRSASAARASCSATSRPFGRVPQHVFLLSICLALRVLEMGSNAPTMLQRTPYRRDMRPQADPQRGAHVHYLQTLRRHRKERTQNRQAQQQPHEMARSRQRTGDGGNRPEGALQALVYDRGVG